MLEKHEGRSLNIRAFSRYQKSECKLGAAMCWISVVISISSGFATNTNTSVMLFSKS